MPVIKVGDKGGDTMTLLEINGHYLPVLRVPGYNQEEEVRSMECWEARPDDVLLCAYPKSGTHWIWEVVCMLYNGKAERIQSMKEVAMLEGSSKMAFDKKASPRILNTHLLHHQLPADFKRKKCKMVYLLRNPKDVAVSFYNHHIKLKDYEYTGSWENYLDRFMNGQVDYGSWFEFVLQWEQQLSRNTDIPHIIVHYEDMKEDPLREVKRLCDFLEKDIDLQVLKDIVHLCDFNKMKKDKDPLEDLDEWKDQQPGMYRKGEVGDWKNWFTSEQDKLFSEFYNEKMKTSNITLKYDLQPSRT